MAMKRMFDRAIIDTDRFMDLPMTAKAIYFLLGMEADDEGFVSYKKVLRIHGGNEDDVKVLLTKNFLIGFPTGVVVITDWNTNNWLDARRIKGTEYQNEKKLLSLTPDKKYVLSNGLASVEECSTEQSINYSETSSPNLKDLYKNMGLPAPAKRKVNLWQDEAATAIKYLVNGGEEKASSVFKAFRDHNQVAKTALSDCKELGKTSADYFFKIYNETIKKSV
jgi:hypothetical protein